MYTLTNRSSQYLRSIVKPIEPEYFANFITDLDYKHNYKVAIRYLIYNYKDSYSLYNAYSLGGKGVCIGKTEKLNMILVRRANS